MVLVDTSVWIDFIRGRATPPVARLRAALDHGVGGALTSFIYQEILQGADSERSLRELETYFGGQRFLHPRDPVSSHAGAARLFFDCRRRGRTCAPRSIAWSRRSQSSTTPPCCTTIATLV